MQENRQSKEENDKVTTDATASGATNFVIVYERMRAVILFNQRRPLSQRLRSRKWMAIFFGAMIALQIFNLVNVGILTSRIPRHQASQATGRLTEQSSDVAEPSSSSDENAGAASQEELYDVRQDSSKSKTSATMGKIIVTTKDIDEGAKISADALEERWMESNKIPDDAVREEKSIIGKTATYGVSKWQMVSVQDIAPVISQPQSDPARNSRSSERARYIALAIILGELSIVLFVIAKLYGARRIFVSDQGIQIQWFGRLKAPPILWSSINTVASRKLGGQFSFAGLKRYQSQSIDIAVSRSSYPIGKWWLLRLAALMLPDARWSDLFKSEAIVSLDAQGIVHESDRRQFIDELERRVGAEFMNPAIKALITNDEEVFGFTKVWLDNMGASGSTRGLDPLQSGDALAGGEYQVVDRIAAGGQAITYVAKRQSGKPNVESGLSSSGSAEQAPVQAGENASGAMSLAANDQQLTLPDLAEDDHIVVLKEFVLPERGGVKIRNRALANIEHEALLLRKIDNPHVVKFVDSFVQGNRAYLVMEKVEGQSLRSLVHTQGPFVESRVRDLANQMCDILQYLHEQTPPIIHRDFTPDNLMLKPNGQLVLIDFNVADQLEQNCTKAVVGKHCYMPPEQFRGYPTIQSDIYAMGATLFYLLTGEDPEAITASHPRAINVQISETMDTVVFRATNPIAVQRYSDAQALKLDLNTAVVS